MKELDTGGFLDLLFGHAPESGYVCIATYPHGVYDPSPQVGPTSEHWFAWPDQRQDIVATIAFNKRNDMYICPILFERKPGRDMDEDGNNIQIGGRRQKNVKWLGVVFADADAAHPKSFKLSATIEVETSPGSHHLYWVIPEGDGDVQRYTRSGRAMAYATEGCDTGGWDMTQLLRVPSTTNNKPSLSEPYKVTAKSSGLTYTIEEIEEIYPTTAAQQVAVDMPDENFPKKLPDYSLVYAKVSDNSVLVDLLNATGRMPSGTSQGNRSELLWKLILELAREGLTREEAFVLSWAVKFNKFRTGGRSKSFWWQQVVKGYETLKVEERVEAEDTAAVQVELKDKAIQLLTPREREAMPVTWIDKYKAWGATKTDADQGFQEGAAWTVLSSVFGEFGKPATKFDSGNLNLWMMVLGGTTLSRKSTVRSMMLKTLRMVSDEVYDYEAGSNVTPEGLGDFLRERPGWTSLYHRDEVHGLNEEMKGKSYLTGLQELMTELYDGQVPGKLRAGAGKDSKGNAKGAGTNFCMYLTGATNSVINTYTMNDFASGHLARFLYVYAEPREMTPDRLYIQQAEEPDANQLNSLSFGEAPDRPYQYLLDELKKGRDYWSSKIERGKQQNIYWEADAWKRFNQIQTRAMFWANDHSLKDALLPTTQRTIISLLKMASLLAMMERSPRVQMRHLIRATAFMESSLTHLTVVLHKLHTTGRSALLDEIITNVRLAGEQGLTKNAIYKPFMKRYKKEVFWAMVADLADAGEVYVENGRIKRKE